MAKTPNRQIRRTRKIAILDPSENPLSIVTGRRVSRSRANCGRSVELRHLELAKVPKSWLSRRLEIVIFDFLSQYKQKLPISSLSNLTDFPASKRLETSQIDFKLQNHPQMTNSKLLTWSSCHFFNNSQLPSPTLILKQAIGQGHQEAHEYFF